LQRLLPSIGLNLLHDLSESFTANRLALQDLVKGVMADACIAFKPSNPNPQHVLLNIFARNHLFGLLVFERLEFNKT